MRHESWMERDERPMPKTSREALSRLHLSARAIEAELDAAGYVIVRKELPAALRSLCEADRDDLNDSTSEVWQRAIEELAKATRS